MTFKANGPQETIDFAEKIGKLLKKGDVIGRAVFYDGENEVASLPIEALTDAPKRKVKKTFWQWLLGLFRK